MSVNKTALQIIWQHLCLQPQEGGRVVCCGTHMPTGVVVGIAKQHHRNFMKLINSSLPPVTYIWRTLSGLFTHFT
jgi:hypothetical protein